MGEAVDPGPLRPTNAAAGEAALRAALLALASRLEVVAVDRARAAADVRGQWQGPHRRRFDSDLARRNARAAAVIADCRRLAIR